MSHSRLGRQSCTGKALAGIDWAVATLALDNNLSANTPCDAALRVDHQAQAEGRQFENARITS